MNPQILIKIKTNKNIVLAPVGLLHISFFIDIYCTGDTKYDQMTPHHNAMVKHFV